MSDHIVIRRAESRDATQMAAVQVASWHEAYHDLIPPEVLDGFDLSRRAIEWRRTLDRGADAWVATEDELVVGIGKARVNEVEVLYVHPAWWNLGIGRRLLEAMWAEIAAAGHSTTFLWALSDNAAGRRFYERLGGTAGDRRPVRVGGIVLSEIAYTWRLPIGART